MSEHNHPPGDVCRGCLDRIAELERRNEALIAHHNDVCPGGVIEREPAPAIEGHEREAD